MADRCCKDTLLPNPQRGRPRCYASHRAASTIHLLTHGARAGRWEKQITPCGLASPGGVAPCGEPQSAHLGPRRTLSPSADNVIYH